MAVNFAQLGSLQVFTSWFLGLNVFLVYLLELHGTLSLQLAGSPSDVKLHNFVDCQDVLLITLSCGP